MIYYLNPHWKAENGGQLRLFLPQNQTSELQEETEVVVDPLGDRLLIFQSATVEHEVLASNAPRYALTLWLH